MAPKTKNKLRRRRGLGLVELLACLGISSLLLTATGVAYLGSFNSYREILARGQMLNAGRSALANIVRDIRMCDACSSITYNGFAGIQMSKAHPDSIDSTAGPAGAQVFITYWYDSSTRQLMGARQQGAATPLANISPLVAGVQSCNFTLRFFSDTSLQQAVIALNIANQDANGNLAYSGGRNVTLTLVDAAAPRRH